MRGGVFQTDDKEQSDGNKQIHHLQLGFIVLRSN